MPLTWTYAPDFATLRDQVRLLVGDTDTADKQLYDEEIAQLGVFEGGNVARTAARAARAIAAKYARKVSKAMGRLRIEYSDRVKHYTDLAAQLDEETGSGAQARKVYAGGLTKSDDEALAEDEDRKQPYFAEDMGENTGVQYGVVDAASSGKKREHP